MAQRGRGLRSPASLVIGLLLATALGALACERPQATGRRSARSIRVPARADAAACTSLPDTLAEAAHAVLDSSDFPDARLQFGDGACTAATVAWVGFSSVQRTYRVPVTRGATLVARARGELGSVTLAFDVPASANRPGAVLARTVVDSIRVDATGEVAVRVSYVPKLRIEPGSSRVALTVLVRRP